MFVGAAPTDMELMSSMMQKIALLEQKVKSQAQEIQLKVKMPASVEPHLGPVLTVLATLARTMFTPSLGFRQCNCSVDEACILVITETTHSRGPTAVITLQ